ncbi:coagulation factor IX-like [Eudromia elegans]
MVFLNEAASSQRPEESQLPEMERGSSLVVLLLLMSSIDSSSLFSFSVFMRKDKAHEVLSVHKRANYFLEEIRPGNLERECIEEKCSFEEAKEIFHSREKTMEFWFNYKGLNPCNTNPCRNGGVCKIRHYSYFCICPPSFSGENCEREKQQCWYKNGGCWHYCQDTDSAFQVGCSCAQGYAPHEDGKRCVQSAPFPCGLIKVRRALEQEPPGRKIVPRNLHELRNNSVTEGNRSMEGDALGGTEPLANAVEQCKPKAGDTGQSELGEVASQWNRTRADAVEQTKLEDGAAGLEQRDPEQNGTVERTSPSVTGRASSSRQEQPAGAAGRNATTGAAAGPTTSSESRAGQSEVGAAHHRPREPPEHDGGEETLLEAPHPRLNGGDARIAGGMFCQRGQCPWQVLIRNSRGEGFCGGSLISSRWVVTAAHCLDLVRPHHVTVGDFDKYQREMKEQKIGVERSWPHPHYDSDNYNSDIALLYLSSEVAFNEFALPICLPSPNLAALLTEEGRVGTVSGWGATHQRGATLRFLMRVRVPVVSMESCQRSMDRLVTDNMFCAGYEVAAEDACKGDSGGPFAVPYHNTWFLLGIVSWGEGCAEKGKYGVYTRVANYIPWIKEVVESVSDSEKILY